MAQPSWQTDGVDVEPSAPGTRLINRATADDSLQFNDPVVTAALRLIDLVGLRQVGGLATVAASGDGAEYTDLQTAIDAASAGDILLVLGGTYTGNFVIEKDLAIIGIGNPSLVNSLADATVAIQKGALTPTAVRLQGLTINNTDDGEECVYIQGATTASGTVTPGVAPLTAADTLTIGGTGLVGVIGTRTSGSDDFSVSFTTVAEVADEIAAAINDPANSFNATVRATSSAGVVTIRARAPGTGGNAITLATSTGDIAISAATLLGGLGGSGSTVGSTGIDILDCVLPASGVGGFQVRTSVINNITVRGGSWRGSSSTSLSELVQTAAYRMFGVEWANDLTFSYDTGGTIPSVATSVAEVQQVNTVGDILSNHVGEGSLLLAHCHAVGAIVAGGDTTIEVSHCRTGTVSLDDTVAATFVESTRGVASVAGGTPTLAESVFTLPVTFAVSASEVVPFEVPQADTAYAVLVDSPDITAIPQATTKTAASFTLTTTAPISGTVYATVMRQL